MDDPRKNGNCLSCQQTLQRVFPNLDEPARKRWCQQLHHVVYRKQETIFHCDEPAGWLLLIGQGQAELVEYALGGHRSIIQRCGPGDCLGIEALLNVGQKVRHYAAEALTSLHAWLIRRNEFDDLLQRYPACAGSWLQSFAAALHERNLHISSLPAQSTEEKIMQVIYLQYQQQCRWFGESDTATLQLTNAQLSGLVGCAAETASKTICKLQRQQSLTRQNGLILLGEALGM